MAWPDDSSRRTSHLSVVRGASRFDRSANAQRAHAHAEASASGGTARARVAAVTDRCWQCRTKVRGIVGALRRPVAHRRRQRLPPFEEISEQLLLAIDPRTLSARRIGELRHRDSPGVVGGYVANGCIECDALIGRFQLEDLLNEHLQNGGTYAQLDIGVPIELPLVVAAAEPPRVQLADRAAAAAARPGSAIRLNRAIAASGNARISRDNLSFGLRFARMLQTRGLGGGLLSPLLTPGLFFVLSSPLSRTFPLCQLLSRNGRSPSALSPRASSSSPSVREESARSASTSSSITSGSSSTRPSSTSATTSCVPRTSPSCAVRSRRVSGPTPSRPLMR